MTIDFFTLDIIAPLAAAGICFLALGLHGLSERSAERRAEETQRRRRDVTPPLIRMMTPGE